MITEYIGDIFDTDPSTTAIIHQCNAFHTMGGGIARIIAERYPEAYEADKKTGLGDSKKMGTFSYAEGKDGRAIFNVYSQFRYGGSEEVRHTNYEAIARGFAAVREHLDNQPNNNKNIAIPYGYGSVRGGGNWQVVRAIIVAEFSMANFDVDIIKLPNQADL